MPPNKAKRGKKKNQEGGWFFERSDPIFGKFNRYVGDKIIKPVDNDLKETKLLSKIAGPVGGFFGGPAGAVVGNLASAGLNKAGYGRKPCRPSGKHPQHGCGTMILTNNSKRLIPSGLPMRAKPIYKPQTGGNSPFMLTNNSSFNSIKLR